MINSKLVQKSEATIHFELLHPSLIPLYNIVIFITVFHQLNNAPLLAGRSTKEKAQKGIGYTQHPDNRLDGLSRKFVASDN